MQNAKAVIPFGFLLALGLVISTHLVTDAMRDIRMSHQIIKVRRYSETQVESGLAIWTITVKVRKRNVEEAYPVVAAYREKVLDFLKNNGVATEETKIFAISVNTHQKRTAQGYTTSGIEAFELIQTIQVKSKDVQNISKISTAITDLLGEGVGLQAGMPRYYYTQVNELKSELLVAATKDAQMRARTLAEGSGVKLGPLRAARQGAFSVRPAFKEEGNTFQKSIGEADLKVDFDKPEIIYPKDRGLKVNREDTCNFSQNENFVVFECVHRLLEKGYKPEHLELEPTWRVGHGASGGRADILVKDQEDNSLLIIECKTADDEFEKA
jgi:hypothetical protein